MGIDLLGEITRYQRTGPAQCREGRWTAIGCGATASGQKAVAVLSAPGARCSEGNFAATSYVAENKVNRIGQAAVFFPPRCGTLNPVCDFHVFPGRIGPGEGARGFLPAPDAF